MKAVGDDLDRDVAIQLRVARAIDLAHAARAEGGFDLIRTKESADRESHGGMAGLYG